MPRQKSWLASAAQRVAFALGLQQKKAPFIWPSYRDGEVHWGMGNFMEYVSEGFELNALVYASIMYKVRAVSQPRLKIYDYEGSLIESEKHPLMSLQRRPNEFQSWAGFNGSVETYLNLSGNAYVYVDRGRDGAIEGPVKAMYTLRPDRVHLIPKDGMIAGYLYRPDGATIRDGIPIMPENIMHFKFPNPADRFEGLGYGLSPIAPMARSGDVDNQVTKFLKIFFDRGALPAGVLKHNQPLEPDQVMAIKARWRETYGGVDNWAEVGVLDSDTEYQRIGYNFTEMGFESIDDRNESRAPMPFGVPPILIGSKFGMKHSTYSNYGQARLAFWQDTMAYELQIQESEYTERLRQPDGSYLAFDLSTVPAYSKDVGEQVKSAQTLWSMGVPPRIAFDVVGLRVGEYPGMDESKQSAPALPAPADQQQQQQQEDVPDPKKALPRGRQVRTLAEATSRLAASDDDWHRARTEEIEKKGLTFIQDGQDIMDTLEARYLKQFMDAADAMFDEDLQFTLAAIHDEVKKAYSTKATVSWSGAIKTLEEYYAAQSPSNWTKAFTPIFSGTVKGAGDAWTVRTGLRFNVKNLLAEKWFASYALQFAKPVAGPTMAVIKSTLTTAQTEGWSIGKTQDALTTYFNKMKGITVDPAKLAWINERVPAHRTEMIARTELIRAANAGSEALFKNWGAKEKAWSAAADDRTRPHHKAADGQHVPIMTPFTIGGHKMDYPGDMTLGAPVSEIVNCRCAVVPGNKFATANPTGTINPGPTAAPGTPAPAPAGKPVASTPKKPAPVKTSMVLEPSDPSTFTPAPSLMDKFAGRGWSEIEKWKEDWQRKLEDTLTGPERSALRKYSGGDYREINAMARRNLPMEGQLNTFKKADAAMEKLDVEEELQVFRGSGKDFLDWMLPPEEQGMKKGKETLDRLMGTTFLEKGYMSTSTDINVANNFNDNVTMKINIRPGVKGAYIEKISHYPGEREMLLARDTELRFVKWEEGVDWRGSPNGKYVIYMEVVTQGDTYEYR